ncbi:MAG TPA: LLM class F420-dependent oxidoreductase [Pseudonocardia sp.]|nr:LLM class F420-dependent oxidoreductase [Pseudonocardia sp.]
MRIGMMLSYSGGFTEAVAEVADHERAGLGIVWVPEAYSFDAVSQLGYLAARTSRLEIAAGVLQIYTRTPTLTAMTAAGLDFVSGGRFTLGLGASNPQVVEGFHGVRYDAPVARTREIVEICRAVWRRERVEHDGGHYRIPLPPEQGTGLGKPLRLINHPVRERIPIVLAALGPRNVALAAEIAEGWLPILYVPERARVLWGSALDAGRPRRDPLLGPLDVVASATLCVTDDADRAQKALDDLRPFVALYAGGMGARGRNFYNDVVRGYGWENEARLIQDLYLDGKKEAAAGAVPTKMVEAMALVGPRGHVAERLAVFAAAGVTTLNVTPLGGSRGERVAQVATVVELAGEV